MNFELSADQKTIVKTVSDFVKKELPLSRMRKLRDDRAGFSRDTWKQLGDLGWLGPGDTVPEFEKVMDGLKVGDLSEPVKSPFGWHLIRVEERRSADVSAEREKLQVRQSIRARKADENFDDWLRQQRDKAYVEIRAEEP